MTILIHIPGDDGEGNNDNDGDDYADTFGRLSFLTRGQFRGKLFARSFLELGIRYCNL